jgi:hypothetical protein
MRQDDEYFVTAKLTLSGRPSQGEHTHDRRYGPAQGRKSPPDHRIRPGIGDIKARNHKFRDG